MVEFWALQQLPLLAWLEFLQQNYDEWPNIRLYKLRVE